MGMIFARVGVALAAVFAALVIAIAGISFVCGSLYLVLVDDHHMVPSVAALLTGIIAFLVAALIIAMGFWFASGRTRTDKGVDALGIAALLGNVLGKRASGYTKEGLIASFLVGFTLAVSPRLRNLLKDLLRR